MSRTIQKVGLACVIGVTGSAARLAAEDARPGASPSGWKQHDVGRPKPPAVEPAPAAAVASKPPSDAVVLFDGANLDAWKASSGGPAGWKVAGGYMETAPGAGQIETKRRFGDVHLHVEWAAPTDPAGKGQDRGNSGVFLMGQFEVQVLDSYKAETYADGQAGAIYGQFPPLANASRPPGEWQTYDVAFRRPRFDQAGRLIEPARLTLFHNGVLVQNNEKPFGPTSWLKWMPYEDQGGRGPVALQDHDHPVRYRNIWVRELPDRPGPPTRALDRPETVAVPTATLDRYAGRYAMDPRPGGSTVKVARVDGHLTVAFPFRNEPLVLEPVSPTTFDMTATDGRFTFQTGDGESVTGVLFRVGDSERVMRRVGP